MKKNKITLIIVSIFLLGINSILFAQESGYWSKTNLNEFTFRNGDTIKEAKTNEEWWAASKAGIPAWCYYNNDTLNGIKYGKLYNWFAVCDSRGLAPIGWHIPTDKEWELLIESYGGAHKTVDVLKATCKGLNSGFRSRKGEFSSIGFIVDWWTLNPDGERPGYRAVDSGTRGTMVRGIAFKGEGLSVRCIKD